MGSSANIAPGGKAERVMSVLRDRIKDAMAGRIAVAFGWTAFGTVLSQVIRLVTSLIMTRLLVPEMFGTMSIVLSVQITIALFLDIG
ncbi:MAG: teichoic acid transporter, partial [Pseudomonadota bacterium]